MYLSPLLIQPNNITTKSSESILIGPWPYQSLSSNQLNLPNIMTNKDAFSEKFSFWNRIRSPFWHPNSTTISRKHKRSRNKSIRTNWSWKATGLPRKREKENWLSRLKRSSKWPKGTKTSLSQETPKSGRWSGDVKVSRSSNSSWRAFRP